MTLMSSFQNKAKVVLCTITVMNQTDSNISMKKIYGRRERKADSIKAR